ncbi:hypothetical protein Bbelb_274880 [Branchiostoma belcheri]|nr:hypothetical protein Bbelb_274880 [Branchiostoma belcheri]
MSSKTLRHLLKTLSQFFARRDTTVLPPPQVFKSTATSNETSSFSATRPQRSDLFTPRGDIPPPARLLEERTAGSGSQIDRISGDELKWALPTAGHKRRHGNALCTVVWEGGAVLVVGSQHSGSPTCGRRLPDLLAQLERIGEEGGAGVWPVLSGVLERAQAALLSHRPVWWRDAFHVPIG